MSDIVRKSLNLLLKQQTNILSAAFILMSTVILSQILGLFRDRLLLSIFGASNIVGIYQYAAQLPETLFQLTIGAALASAFIPVFSDYLAKNKEKEAHRIATTLLTTLLLVFLSISIMLSLVAPYILPIFNLGGNFTPGEMQLMVNMMRIIIIGQILFIIATFFTAFLQSYNHFLVPGIAGATYNLGIIIGITVLSPYIGIYSAAMGIVLGAFLFIIVQIPLVKKTGFSFLPSLDHLKSEGMKKITTLMGPRIISMAVLQLGIVSVVSFISVLEEPGRMKTLYELAKTLSYAPVMLFGLTIAQAAFPVLSREKDKLEDFKITFITSFNQMLYLILPISAIILVLRIPIVRLIYGADMFDWEATVLTGQILAVFSFSIFAQALLNLLYRAFFALQNTVTPLIVGAISTLLMIVLTYFLVVYQKGDIQSVAVAFTISYIFQVIILFILLDRRVNRFDKIPLILSALKFFVSTLFMALAIYIPIKLLDQLVIDTTRTFGLIILTGIASLAGFILYLFLTWLFDVSEAHTYIAMFKKLGNWRDILDKSDEVITPTQHQ